MKIYNSILFLFSISILIADCENPDYVIQENYFNETIVGFYLDGFDLTTGQSNILLFDYSILSPSGCYNTNHKLSLNFEIYLHIPGFENDFDVPFAGATVVVSNIEHEINVKNTDLNVNAQLVGADVDVSDDDIIKPKQEQIDILKNLILQQGKLPNGTYTFKLILSDYVTEYESSKIKIIDVYEPTYIELVSPGGNLSDTSSTAIMGTYPVFTWSTDICSACSYGIRVCEFDPSRHSSLSDAINDVSSLPLNNSIDFYSIPNNSNVFQYPTSGAIDLFEGKLYVWQLQRTYETTIGHTEDLSEIFVFKIQSLEDSFESNYNPNLELLKELLGETKFNKLFGEGGELKDYLASDLTVTLNGEEIPISNLYTIVTQLRSGSIHITEIGVE